MKKIFALIMIVLLVLLTGCSSPEKPPETGQNLPVEAGDSAQVLYSIKLFVSPAEGGSVDPSEAEFPEGTTVTIKANASAGYVFDHWSGSASGYSPYLTIVMNQNKSVTAHFVKKLTPTPAATATSRPTPTATSAPCRNPAEISSEDVGEIVEICGEVTNWGNVPCPTCALGGYSFIKLESEFLIISYDWMFNNNWIGNCILVADTVEQLGKDTVFIFGKGEGYAGSECTTEGNGQMSCNLGEYFNFYSGCD